MSYAYEILKNLETFSTDLKCTQAAEAAKNKKPTEYKMLIEQIIDLMKTTPQHLLNRPWSMAELIARLEGKYRDRPHPQHVGQALRLIGWQSRRYWSNGWNGVRVWLPPLTL